MRLAVCTLISFLAAAASIGGETSKASPLPAPDVRVAKYGSHERNVLDLWRAKSTKPVPLLVYIHGGGWRGGDKSVIPPQLLNFMLQHGVSVASINYRYSDLAPLPAPVHDAARAIQFLRSKSAEWRLNKKRVAAIGASAGACTSLWLAYHDDLVNGKSDDPVARESSRLCAAVGISGQTSIDPEIITGWVGEQVLQHGMIWHAVGASSPDEVKIRYLEYRELYREFSPINHISKGDPPVLLIYPTPSPLPAPDPGTAIHHAIFGIKMKEKSDTVGGICVLKFSSEPDQSAPEIREFLLKYLTQE